MGVVGAGAYHGTREDGYDVVQQRELDLVVEDQHHSPNVDHIEEHAVNPPLVAGAKRGPPIKQRGRGRGADNARHGHCLIPEVYPTPAVGRGRGRGRGRRSGMRGRGRYSPSPPASGMHVDVAGGHTLEGEAVMVNPSHIAPVDSTEVADPTLNVPRIIEVDLFSPVQTRAKKRERQLLQEERQRKNALQQEQDAADVQDVLGALEQERGGGYWSESYGCIARIFDFPVPPES